jgi:phage anti-repressor protein
LEDFLITHSKIDKTFIYDFFMIQKIGKNSEYKPFIMDLELVAKWLDTGKKDIKDTLKASYIENVDYKVMGVDRNNLKKSKKSKNLGGRPSIKIYITTNCFKLLCMRSKTAKSEEVRKYYLELEKLVDEYKDYIIKTQEEKIRNLEYELNPEKLPSDGYFYIYEVGEYYRTGATKNLKLRFKTHNSSHPQTIRPIIRLKVDDPFKLESCVNNLLNQFRIKKNKDFFKVDFGTLISIIKDCGIIIDVKIVILN